VFGLAIFGLLALVACSLTGWALYRSYIQRYREWVWKHNLNRDLAKIQKFMDVEKRYLKQRRAS
jgi:hypothetical protein